MPPFSLAELNTTIDTLIANGTRHLARRPVREILASIDQVIQRWLDPNSSERQEAEARLPETTGLSSEMIQHILPLVFQEYRADNLEALLVDELGSLEVLDHFVSSSQGQKRGYGPRLMTHILAGNLPGAGLDSVIFSLSVKSATLVKTSSTEPLLPNLFARSIQEIDPDLGSCLAIVTWPGGKAALEDVALTRADVVVASGSDESLAFIRQRVRGRFIGYGHKVSFSLVTKERLTDVEELAQQTAYDVALYDQQGCLSPQLVYVQEGGATTPKDFAALLAVAFAHWQIVLPRGPVTPDMSTAIRKVRGEAEWQALAGKDVVLHTSPRGTDWTVIYDTDPMFVPSPLYRTIRVKPLQNIEQLSEIVDSWRPYLEAVGVAAGPGQMMAIADKLAALGVARVCPIGTIQTPPLSWQHGERPRIGDFVRWVGLERRR